MTSNNNNNNNDNDNDDGPHSNVAVQQNQPHNTNNTIANNFEEEEEEDPNVSEMEKLLALQEEEAAAVVTQDRSEDDDYVMLNNDNSVDVNGINEYNNENEPPLIREDNNDINNNDNNNQDPFMNDLPPPPPPQNQPNNEDPHPHQQQANIPPFQPEPPQPQINNIPNNNTSNKPSFLKTNYTTLSILLTTIHILYILRTRKQIYLSLMYLTTSRISYILIGNTILSTFYSLYHTIISFFLKSPLRLIEIETISEHIRWNITESVFALTMFRQEVNVQMMMLFMIVFWLKCLHWAVELRGNHLRMTEEVFYFVEDEDLLGLGGNGGSGSGGNSDGVNEVNVLSVMQTSTTNNTPTTTTTTTSSPSRHGILTTLYKILTPQSIQTYLSTSTTIFLQKCPRIRISHIKYYLLMNLLYMLDLSLIAYCSNELLNNGPSASILFLFEGTIMLITMMSCYFLYGLHCLDGWISVMQRFLSEDENEHENDGQEENEGTNNESSPTTTTTTTTTATTSKRRIYMGRIASIWRDNRAKANFTVELMSLSAKFLLHLTLFVTVFATYGLPISIIRDFYVAFLKLRRRLSAFISYRKLTKDLDTKFENVTTEEELDDVGRVCIICREPLDVHGIHGVVKKLACGHAFHQHCLREWLVQQQNCPTCRSDIKSSEARVSRFDNVEQEEEEEEVEVEEEEHGNHEHIHTDNAKKEEELIINSKDLSFEFPVLCKVNQNVPVVDFMNNDNDSTTTTTCQVITKILQKDKVVVCTESKLWSWNESRIETEIPTNNDDDGDNGQCSLQLPNDVGAGLYCRTPDGWIRKTDLTKLVVLKRQKVE